MRNPAKSLCGVELDGGWKVEEMVSKNAHDTGGKFSICYRVSNQDGRLGFLKALDFSAAFETENPAETLNKLTESFLHEAELLEICRPMSRIVTALDFGTVNVDVSNSISVVQYIIFELAEASIRSVIYKRQKPPFEWMIRWLHEATVGMNQLHSKQISHQDFKPSNALIFPNEGLKIADLGRSIRQGREVSHESHGWPGDWSYVPPELAYGYFDSEFQVRRLSCDIYLLGSFAVSLLTGMQLTVMIVEELPKDVRPPVWNGNYRGKYVEVIAFVERAFATVLEKISYEVNVQESFFVELMDCVRELCQPDPRKRGHPKNHTVSEIDVNTFSLERYISRFDLLANRARLYDRKVKINERHHT